MASKTMAAPRRAGPYAVLLLLVLACCFLRCAAAAAQPQPAMDEVEILLQIKREWDDPDGLAEWRAGSAAGAHCRWPEVGCDAAGRVTWLDFIGTNLAGPIPDAIGGLLGLAHLCLFDNDVTGGLPDDIGHGFAASLRKLDLSCNSLNGTIPTSISGFGTSAPLRRASTPPHHATRSSPLHRASAVGALSPRRAGKECQRNFKTVAGSPGSLSRTPMMGHTGKQGRRAAGTGASTYLGNLQKHEHTVLATAEGQL